MYLEIVKDRPLAFISRDKDGWTVREAITVKKLKEKGFNCPAIASVLLLLVGKLCK